MIKQIPRWRSAVGASLICVGFGLLTGSAPLLAAAVIPLVHVAVSSLSGVSEDLENRVHVDRAFDGVPVPGESITVELTIQNTSDAPLPDLRVLDGVPDALRVVDGSPRGTASLTAGDEMTISYDVVAVRGDHEFEAPRLQARNATASSIVTATSDVHGDRQLSSRVTVEDVELPKQTMNYTGDLPTEQGGEGVEFYSTREYRRGDPMSRIHWRHLAKTGEMTTINYREHKAAKVVLVVDAREEARVAPKPGYPSAVEYSTYAASRIMNALTDDGHLVGVATVGTHTDETAARAPLEWIAPGGGAELKARVTSLFETVLDATTTTTVSRGTISETSPDSTTDARTPTSPWSDDADTTAAADGGLSLPNQLRKHLPADAQVVVVSPVLDDYLETFTTTLRAHSHAVTVVSPDVTAPSVTAGGALAGVDRALQLDALRDQGAYVIDWDPDVPLPLALATTVSPSTQTNGN